MAEAGDTSLSALRKKTSDYWIEVEEEHLNNLRRIRRRHASRVSAYQRRRTIIIFQFIGLLLSHLSLPQRTIWVRPRHVWWNKELGVPGVNLESWTDSEFRENLRMSASTFQAIVRRIGPAVNRQDTRFRKAIPVNIRIAVTIWRLATNAEYRTLSHLFSLGISTICEITRDVCQAIWTLLKKDTINFPTGARAAKVIDGFL